MALTKVKLIADGVITSANLDASHGITTSDIGEGSNLYYTDSRVSSYLSTNGFATQTDIVAAITDSAPVTLDTLNELAAALGDDPNFATTTATSLGLKAPLASPSFTGNATFASDVYITGSSNSNVVISRDNLYVDAGQLYIGADDALTDDTFRQRTASGSYFIESRKSGTWTNRLQINSAGTLIAGQGATFGGNVTTENIFQVYSTGVTAVIGAIGNTANDLNIYSTTAGHNGLRMHVNGILPTDHTGTIIDNDADLGDPNYRFKNLYLAGDGTFGGKVGIGTTSPLRKLSVVKNTTITGGFNDISEFLDTTIGAGGSVSLNIGRANSTKNLGKMAFKYAGSGSNSNAINWGFYDADNLMTLLASGNVGIGETNPASTLVVRSDSAGGRGGEITILNYATNTIGNEAALNFGLENSTYAGDVGNAQIKALTTASNAASDIVFSTWNGSSFGERMRITSGGDGYIAGDLVMSKGVDPRIYAGSGVGFNIDGEALYLNRYTSSNIAMVTGGGKVGIGVTSPASKLHVHSGTAHGEIRLTTATSSGYDATMSLIAGQSGGVSILNLGYNGDDDYTRILRTSAGSLRFDTNNAERMTIDSSGRTTITGSAGYLFDVQTTDTNQPRLQVYVDDTNGVSFISGYNTTPKSMLFYTGGSERMRIDSSGRVFINSGQSWVETFIDKGLRIKGSRAGTILESGSTLATHVMIAGSNSSTAVHINHNSSGHLSFYQYSAGKETLRLHESGGITFNGDTAAANALDDYEEGTWTPDIHGSTTRGTVSYQYRSGSYTKIGNRVWCRFGFKLSSISGATGRVRVDGLPFVSRSYGSYQEPNFSVSTGLLATTANAYRARMFVVNSSSYLEGRISVNTDTIWNISDFGGDEWIILAFHYETHI